MMFYSSKNILYIMREIIKRSVEQHNIVIKYEHFNER